MWYRDVSSVQSEAIAKSIMERAGEGEYLNPFNNECSYSVLEAFNIFRRCDKTRGFFFTQGMKTPSYHYISTRQVLDEIEAQGPITDTDHLCDLVEIIDSIAIERKNKPS